MATKSDNLLTKTKKEAFRTKVLKSGEKTFSLQKKKKKKKAHLLFCFSKEKVLQKFGKNKGLFCFSKRENRKRRLNYFFFLFFLEKATMTQSLLLCGRGLKTCFKSTKRKVLLKLFFFFFVVVFV